MMVQTSSLGGSDFLSPLAGCWETKNGTREVWEQGAPDLWFGYNVVQRNGETVFFEDLRIEKAEETWTLVASPGGAAPTRFMLSHADQSAVAFENPDHDFPQRIRYRWNEGGLLAQAESLDGTDTQSWNYVRCGKR